MSFFLIIGMHRSGTSCLAGSLERCGIYLGDVKKKGKYNKKGYFEIEEVYRIHDQILGLNRGTWKSPPTHKLRVHPYHFLRLKAIIEPLKLRQNSGLKDPRTLLFINTWKRLIGRDIQFIGSFRHPKAVAQSLFYRNGMSEKESISLWKTYNQILVEEHQRQPFPIIHYDMSNTSKYKKDVIDISKQFNLKPQYFKLKWFISSKLQHYHFEDYDLPLSCRDLYNYLMYHAL